MREKYKKIQMKQRNKIKKWLIGVVFFVYILIDTG